ncbi:MAG: DUF6580 family putative transport protein [Verrucomicrobiota bacterium]
MRLKHALPIIFLLVFALTRVPGLMPANFSAVYGLLFCGGVYFRGRTAWWLPLLAMLVTDLGLNLYYQYHLHIPAFQPYLLVNYAAYMALIALGRRFKPATSWLGLLGGGLVGAVLFYLITNTAAWLFNPFQNPEYTKTLAGWIIALTKGTGGYPETWEFFRNTLLSGGLFTGLFAGAMKLTAAAEPQEDEDPEEAPAEEPADTPNTGAAKV